MPCNIPVPCITPCHVVVDDVTKVLDYNNIVELCSIICYGTCHCLAMHVVTQFGAPHGFSSQCVLNPMRVLGKPGGYTFCTQPPPSAPTAGFHDLKVRNLMRASSPRVMAGQRVELAVISARLRSPHPHLQRSAARCLPSATSKPICEVRWSSRRHSMTHA